jgi:hypothetical protein
LLLVLSFGCGGDDETGRTPAPTRAGSPAPLPTDAIAAIGDYMGATGLDGRSFELTDPPGCEEIQEQESSAVSDEEREQIIEATRGRLCVNRTASVIRDDRALATVQEYVSGGGWVLTLQQSEGAWTVTDVQALGFPETE